MDKLIRQNWWKWLGVVILLYVFIVGLLVPLKPNITHVSPSYAQAGQPLTLLVEGYNTHFDEQPDQLRAWLRLDENYQLAARKIEVQSPQQASLIFDLPVGLPSTDSIVPASLVVDGVVDGFFVRPAAISIYQLRSDSTTYAAWQQHPIQGLHQIGYMTFPFRNILAETIRNTYFHVSLWLAMMLIFIVAVVYAVRYLRLQSQTNAAFESIGLAVSSRERLDYWSHALTLVGFLFGLLGLVTGALWAKYTWGSWWSWDIKQFTTLIALLIYAGYFILRSVFVDREARGRISAVYNIFAFAALIPLIYILPRLSDSSLHPGNGGNPALGGEALDNTMRMVFYPAVIGWTLFGGWLASLFYRLRRLEATLPVVGGFS